MTDRVKSKYFKQILSHCHFVNHKSHMNCPDIEPGIQGTKKSASYLLSFYMLKLPCLGTQYEERPVF